MNEKLDQPNSRIGRSTLRRVFLIVFWSVIVVAYQNFSSCGSSDVQFDSLAASSGNGEPFDNKPTNGTYYRWIPGYECKGKPALVGKIKIADGVIQAERLNTESCKQEPQAIALSSVKTAEIASLATHILGFDKSIYLRQESAVQLAQPPRFSAEAFCQSNSVRVVISSLESNQSHGAELTEAPSSSSSALSPRDMGTVDRAIDAQKIKYSSAKVSLEIDRVSVAPGGLSFGRVNYTDSKGQPASHPVQCWLASRLDPENHFFPVYQAGLFGPALPAGFAFQRAGPASYFDANGLLRFAAAGVPRFTHDPSTGLPLGLLIERNTTNRLLNTQSLEAWQITGLTTEVDTPRTTAPDGASTAEYFSVGTAVTRHQVLRNHTIVPGEKYTLSVFAKPLAANAQRFLRLQIVDRITFTNEVWAGFDLVSGTVAATRAGGDGSQVSAGVERLPGGWLRLTLTGIPSASSSDMEVFFQALDTVQSTGVYGDPMQRGFFLWGAQLEVGSAATSYINSDSGIQTRVSDRLSLPTTGWLNTAATSATFMIEGQSRLQGMSHTSAVKRLFVAKGPSGDVAAIEFDPAASIMRAIFSDVVPLALQAPVTPTSGAPATSRYILGYSSSSRFMTVDGSDRSGPAPAGASAIPNDVSIGGETDIEQWQGTIHGLRYWPYQLEPSTRMILTQ